MSALHPNIELSLPAAPSAIGAARRAVAGARLVEPEQQPTLLLLVSELVTNSVRHAGMGEEALIRLRCHALGGCAHIEVCDDGESGVTPARRPRDPGNLRSGGLGLNLVDAMADSWGVALRSGETCVWFELPCAPRH